MVGKVGRDLARGGRGDAGEVGRWVGRREPAFTEAGRRDNSSDPQENLCEASRGDFLGNGSLCRLAKGSQETQG